MYKLQHSSKISYTEGCCFHVSDASPCLETWSNGFPWEPCAPWGFLCCLWGMNFISDQAAPGCCSQLFIYCCC